MMDDVSIHDEREYMDAFEQVVSEILWMDGYWVHTSAKVDLTKQEKVRIGRRRRHDGNLTLSGIVAAITPCASLNAKEAT
jgi:hypothetical protein